MDRLEMIWDTVQRIEKKIDAQNGRIRKLENWRWYVIGIVVGAAAIIGWILQ